MPRILVSDKLGDEGINLLMENGEVGEKYNVTGESEVDNLELAQLIAEYTGKPLKYENNNELIILLKEKFKSERGRINCSLWEEKGKWRWLGIQYVIAEY